MSNTDKYKIKWTARFKKDYKLASKRGFDMGLIDNVIRLLAKGDQQTLKDDYDDHALSGDWKGHRELHILPDWLLVYYTKDDVMVLTLTRTGSHSDLFKK